MTAMLSLRRIPGGKMVKTYLEKRKIHMDNMVVFFVVVCF